MSKDSSFIRRKFTLTEQDDRELERLADQHYDGNVSLCIRAAVADHKSNLSGEGYRALQRLGKEVGTVTEHTELLGKDVRKLIATTDQIAEGQTATLPFSIEDTELQESPSKNPTPQLTRYRPKALLTESTDKLISVVKRETRARLSGDCVRQFVAVRPAVGPPQFQ